MRIDLSRLHTERESMRKVLGHLGSNKISLRRGAAASDKLQRYLADVSDVFFAEARYGFDNSEILQLAYGLDDLVTEGDRPGLERALSGARRSVQQKVGQVSAPQGNQGNLYFIHIEALGIGEGARPMSERKEVNIKNSTVQGSQVAIDMRIGAVTNRIDGAAVDDSLNEKLKELAAAVHEVTGKISGGDAENVTRDLEMLVAEATAPNPRPTAMKRLGQGLIETAKAIGEIGQPIVGLVGAIIALF
ncbi:hypothetical protein ABT072_46895 [Streptomyces sp. NPDC002589]|uniref:hypothetical protein n=1 Tax=Streptomyces sp. NPDC002589 TaxID=3154420 RepID=UPI0033208B0A